MTTIQRDTLELRKLELEIAELERPWWKRPVYLTLVVPILAALIAFVAVAAGGYFDQRRSILEAEIK